MALCTGRGCEGPFPVMTSSAGIAFVHVVHGQLGVALLHQEKLGMTLATTEPFRMALVGKVYRHARCFKRERRQLVAGIAGILVDIRFLMFLDDMASIAVYS